MVVIRRAGGVVDARARASERAYSLMLNESFLLGRTLKNSL